MKLRDAYILAHTKHKTRRIRTALVTIVSSLLFALLFFAALVASGMVNGAEQVKDVGFNSRYLTQVAATGNVFDQSAFSRITTEIDAELRARRIAVTDAVKQQDTSYNMEVGKRLSKALAEQAAAADAKLEQWVRSHAQPTDVYHLTTLQAFDSGALYQPDPTHDSFAEDLQRREETGGQEPKNSSPKEVAFLSVEQKMLTTQIQPGQTFSWQAGKPFPLFVTYSYLEQLSKKPLTNLSATQKNAAYRQLIKEYTGKTLTYCYRNGTAATQMQDVVRYNKKVNTDKDPKTKPINIPVCGGFDQALLKKLDLLATAETPGTKPLFPAPKPQPPVTRTLQFKMVGFLPAAPIGPASLVESIFTSVTPWSNEYPGIVPKEVVDQEPLFQVQDDSGFAILNESHMFVDFATRAEQKAFIGLGCAGSDCNGKKPLITSFGNVKVTLEGLFQSGKKFVAIGALVIMVIAIVMILFTISKVIADSAKEIAVFRAIGARRRDIGTIYLLYGLSLAVVSLVVALLLAVIAATVADRMFADSVQALLVQVTGAYQQDVNVVLRAVHWPWLLLITAGLLGSALIGILIPIVTSLRRALIVMLREE